MPTAAELRDEFLLEPSVTFLNHGSFGACPRPVFERYQAWQLELEREPVEFLGRRLSGLLAAARERLADALGADPGDLVFVPNATSGVNVAARALRLGPEDEVRDRCRALALELRERLAELTGLEPLADPAFVGQMISAPLPPGHGKELQQRLWEEHRIEVPVFPRDGRPLIRASFQGYNDERDLERLLAALAPLLDQTSAPE